MSRYCKGLCINECQQRRGYLIQKYCKTCGSYIESESLRCYCCKSQMRSGPKYNRSARSKKVLFVKN